MRPGVEVGVVCKPATDCLMEEEPKLCEEKQ